jgi:membrane-associated protease RseP (regulator of RpoE activity)
MPVPIPRRPKPRYWLHILLLVATCFTTLIMGARMQFNFAHGLPALSLDEDPIDGELVSFFPASWVVSHPQRVWDGLPFAAAVMFFFLAHEMGHYLYCRHYGIYATLPFFIPMPLPPIGTMGAVIVIRSPIRSRTALFDIGIAGPIAGFVVALGLLFVSLGWSKALPLGYKATPSDLDLGFPLIFQFAHRVLAMLHTGNLLAIQPLQRVILHPVTIAAWVGMFATSLNLLPGGQLDGGHILYSLSPRLHRVISRLTILILLPLAYFFWTGWIIWAVLLQLSSFRHPHVAELPKVSGTRAWFAVFALLMLVSTLAISPIGHRSLPETGHDLGQIGHDLIQYVHDKWIYWHRH